MILRPLILILFLLCPTVDAARADDRLDEAIAAYLADDDEAALPVFAELAAGGDAEARLLLGRIATRPFSPWVASLSRKDRTALLRAPGGLSGKSWLAIASDAGDPVAAALNRALDPRLEAETLENLLSHGEEDAFATALFHNISRGPVRGLETFAWDMRISDDTRFLLWLSYSTHYYSGFENPRAAIQMFESLGFSRHIANAYRAKEFDETEYEQILSWIFGHAHNAIDYDPTALALILRDAPPTDRPISRLRRYCEQACPEAAPVCMAEMMVLAGGYQQLWLLGSPVESIIDGETFLASPRFHADFARHMRIHMDGWADELQTAWTSRSCAAASRFRNRFD